MINVKIKLLENLQKKNKSKICHFERSEKSPFQLNSGDSYVTLFLRMTGISYFTEVLLIIVVLILTFTSCNEKKIKPQVALISSEELPDQESHDATITFTEEGKLKAILYADTIKVFSEKREKDLTGVHIDFYKDEKKTSSITSDKGKIDDRTQDMYAIGNVVAVSDSGITLTTEELVWKKNNKKIVTDKFVKIKSDKEIIEGYGFESDQDMKNYTIFNITYVTTLEN